MSKLNICENCFSELVTVGGFCPHCGSKILNGNGYDIYSKGKGFYLRYRKNKQCAQVPLATDYNLLPADSKKIIYLSAKKNLSAKIAAKYLLNTATDSIKTFGDIVCSYLSYIYNSKVKGTGKGKLKLRSYETGYIGTKAIIEKFPIWELSIKEMNHKSLRNNIEFYISARISGEVTGKPVRASTLHNELSFIKRVIEYAFDEGVYVEEYQKLKKLFKHIADISPTEEDAVHPHKDISALTTDEYILFIKEFFRPEPTTTLQNIFYNICGTDRKLDPITRKFLQYCFDKFTPNVHSLSQILLQFRANELRLFNENIGQSDCRKIFTAMKQQFKLGRTDETWEVFFKRKLDMIITDAAELFPHYYKLFSQQIETTKFDGYFYPVTRTFYHNEENVLEKDFDYSDPNSFIVYKNLSEKYCSNIMKTESCIIPLLLLISQTGLRISEARSLKVGDISDYKLSDGTLIKTITVNHQASYTLTLTKQGDPIRNEKGDKIHDIVETTPKTTSSNRIVPLTPLAELAVNVALKNRNLTLANKSERLFFEDINRGGAHLPNRWLMILLRNIRRYKQNGSHILRHTVASQLARHGYSESFIGQILGHSEKSTTARYITIDIESMYHALCESLLAKDFESYLSK